MVHELSDPYAGARKLTQSVLQVTDMLGMYQAELARILHLQCSDIGDLAAGKRDLEPGTKAWEQAILFVRFYAGLYQKLEGDGVAMCNWLRRENEALRGVPLLLIVDHDRLQETLGYIEECLQRR